MSSNISNRSGRTVTTAQTRKKSSRLRWLWLPVVLLLAGAAGGLTGIVAAYEINSSKAATEVAALATYRPSVVTKVYADDGQTVIGEFALERRMPLRYAEIPDLTKRAILAVEDTRFNDHIGIDPIRIAGALVKNIRTGSREGGSTLTQQLAKDLFLSREQTYTRKVNEWVMALQIERYYTKAQILEMYFNHVFLGARAYGFEAAAQTYFNKSTKDLTLEEAALLAGIPRAPSQYSPTINQNEARERRNLVLELMATNNYVSRAEAEAAKARPIKLADTAYYQPPTSMPGFGYPVEEIRQYLEDKYSTRVALGGLSVYSTINIDAQLQANEAIRSGLRKYDRTHGSWRSLYQNIANPNQSTNPEDNQNGANNQNFVVATPQQLAQFAYPDWYGNNFEPNTYRKGLIMKVDAARNEATARFGGYTAIITSKEMGASGKSPKQEFKAGDLAEFLVKEVNDNARTLKVELSQIPGIQGALVSLNAKNGEIVAMIGGYDFETNKFNNATQAYRQTGSCFKPYVYTAAVEWGMTPESKVSGAPIKRGNWTPHNFDGSRSHGDVPMKTALAKSLNIAAVHLLDMVGIQTGAQMVRRFGITTPMAPYLPSALGATEVPLVQMVSAYSAFPNKGVRVASHLVRRVVDRDGTMLEEWDKETYKVTSEYVALTMVEMMRAVVDNGTAGDAKALGVQVAGKTGTVNDHTDVWFIGYTPTYVTGVWMGYPERKKSLGSDMTGGRGALPIFVDYMKQFLKDKEKEKFPAAPKMPEDMKDLFEQRQREMAEEREAFYASTRSSGSRRNGDSELPRASTEPRLETITLPSGPGGDSTTTTSTPANTGNSGTNNSTTTQPNRPDTAQPRTTDSVPPPAAPNTRPRETDPAKRRGKKGEDDPQE